MSGIDLSPGDPCYKARSVGCTCTWIRGFGVGEVLEEWVEKIIARDPECPAKHDKRRKALSRVGDQGA